MGTKTVDAPLESPITTRAIVTTTKEGANVWINPPIIYMYIINSKARFLPLESAHFPAKTEPNGPPTQKAATATLHSPVVCPGNTKGSGAFITLILYPALNMSNDAIRTAKISGVVTVIASASSSSNSNRLIWLNLCSFSSGLSPLPVVDVKYSSVSKVSNALLSR